MKEGWERTEPPLSLDLKQINEIIKPAFPGKRLTAAERIGTGLSNSNYEIQLEGSDESYLIRFFNGGRDIADKEVAIAQLARQTISVADFIYVDTSSSRFNRPWAVLECKEDSFYAMCLETEPLRISPQPQRQPEAYSLRYTAIRLLNRVFSARI